MSVYSEPTVNELLDEIARAYDLPEYDPATMITVQQFCDRTGLKDSRARNILKADPRLEQLEVRRNGRHLTVFRKKVGP